ncbi:inorganic pyrophosphatase [Firmicutes bacterium CAG:449]|mgnify:CR=1 FL=1|nr:inorganic pyrophosphatase [Firmicutes bacterium CAG:449]
MNIWHDINPKRISEDKFVAYIEIQSGCKNKYELDKETGLLRLDRILYTATHYPANYGFIPRTYGDDNDPLDVLVVASEPIIPMTLVDCRPIGVIKMNDQGSNDEKIIAVCLSDPFYSNVKSIFDLPSHILDEFKHFFEVYKTLENKITTVTEVDDVDEAKNIIRNCMNSYVEKFCK